MTARPWACAAALGLLATGACRDHRDIRVGCFFGGRSYVLFRAYLHGYFEREDAPAVFYSRYLGETDFVPVPRSQPKMQLMRSGPGPRRNFGKVTGDALVRALEAGDFDAVTVGESSFIAAVSRGAPLVAVAALARSARGRPSEAIVLRKGVVIRSPADFRGKRLAGRRSGPGGEAIFLRRFVESIGLDPRRDVTLIEDVDEDSLRRDFRDGSIDGALCRVEMTAQLVRDGFGVVYRPMDWVDPALSQGLIVFRRDFAARHPDRVARFVRAYARSVHDEALVPQSTRAAETSKGLRTVLRFDGLDLPQADDPPLVRLDLLKQMQTLLVQDGVVAKAVDLTPFVNSGFLENTDAAAR
ncbi:MAG: ABC transporter substrate-binding protein [Elusimicrobia bacterium]|nr:ABC transporter substrate-binding protein [Elusimicrobiota bacterium]